MSREQDIFDILEEDENTQDEYSDENNENLDNLDYAEHNPEQYRQELEDVAYIIYTGMKSFISSACVPLGETITPNAIEDFIQSELN
jgi:hypothetical protein